MTDEENTKMVFSRNGVRFSVIGSDKLERTRLRYNLDGGVGGRLEVEVLCDMKGKQNRPCFAEEEAWNSMMWDLVSKNPRQTLIRYIEPDMTVINSHVTLPTLMFNAPAGEPSRVFYVSTGGERGVYVIALDDDTRCICEENKRKLVEEYARRTLYEPLNANQQTVPEDKQTLDEERQLQSMLPRVFSSVADLDNKDPLNLSVTLAVVHYIIVNLDLWRKKNQFYACRNELRLRKIEPRPTGNRILIKEEGDVLFIIMPLDCREQRLCDILLAALQGYCYYLHTKIRSDFFSTTTGKRIRLNKQQKRALWDIFTTHIYNRFYPYQMLLDVGYDEHDVERIPLYHYVDTQHDIPKQEDLTRSSYQQIITTTYDQMKTLGKAGQGISVSLVREWAVEARQLINTYPTSYVGVFDKDSQLPENLSGLLCPLPSRANAAESREAIVEEHVGCGSDDDDEAQQQQEGARTLLYQTLSKEEAEKTSAGYRVINYQSARFSFFNNEDRVLSDVAVSRAAAFLRTYGFVIIKGDFFTEAALSQITSSIANGLSELYVGSYKLKSKQPTVEADEPAPLSAYFELSDSNLKNFPISKRLSRLDLEPLVHDSSVWTQLRGNKKLFECYRSLVEAAPGSGGWRGSNVRLQPEPPVTTFKQKGSARKLRILWNLQPDSESPYRAAVAVNDMTNPEGGGFVLAPGFHKRASAVSSDLKKPENDASLDYYYDLSHYHTLPAEQNSKLDDVPPYIRQLLLGSEEQAGLLCKMAFVPLKAGDVVLFHSNMPHSWLRSSDSNSSFKLGQLYSLTAAEASKEEIESELKNGVLPYEMKGRQKAEIRRKEERKPRNNQWIWLTKAEAKAMRQESIPDAHPGWNWAAARDHSNVNTYNSSWRYEGKTWKKVPPPNIERIPASYDYRQFFYGPDSEQLRKFTFGTRNFSAAAMRVTPGFSFLTASNGNGASTPTELTTRSGLDFLRSIDSNFIEKLQTESIKNRILTESSSLQRLIERRGSKNVTIDEFGSYINLLRVDQTEDADSLSDVKQLFEARLHIRNFMKSTFVMYSEDKYLTDSVEDLVISVKDAFAETFEESEEEIIERYGDSLDDMLTEFIDNIELEEEEGVKEEALRVLDQIKTLADDVRLEEDKDELASLIESEVNSLSDSLNQNEDLLNSINSHVMNLEEELIDRLGEDQAEPLLEALQPIPDMIQQLFDEDDIAEEMTAAAGSLRTAATELMDEEDRSFLNLAATQLTNLSQQLKTTAQQPPPQQPTRKRPRVEEELEQQGISRETIRQVLSIMDAGMYSMQHERSGDRQSVGKISRDNAVYYQALLSDVVIEFRVDELQLLRGDKLRLFFGDDAVAAEVTVDDRLLTLKQTNVSSGRGDNTELVKLLLTTAPSGDIVAVTWSISSNIVHRLIVVRGPGGIKRTRIEPVFIPTQPSTPLPSPPLFIEPEEAPLSTALQTLVDDAARIKDALKTRFWSKSKRSHEEFEDAIGKLAAVYRLSAQEQASKEAERKLASRRTRQLRKAKKKQAKLMKDVDDNVSDPPKELEKLIQARVRAAKVLLTAIEKDQAETARVNVLRLLSSAVSSLKAFRTIPEGEGESYDAAVTALIDSYDLASRNKLLTRDLLRQITRNLERLGNSTTIKNIKAAIDEIFAKYKKRVARETAQPTVIQIEDIEEEEEEKEEEEDSFLKRLSAVSPFVISKGRQPSAVDRESMERALNNAADKLQAAADAVRENAPSTDKPSVFVTLERNLSDFVQPLKSIATDLVPDDNWFELEIVRRLNDVARQQWFILNTSIRDKQSPLYYPREVQQLLRSKAVSKPLLEGLEKLESVLDSIQNYEFMIFTPPSTPPAAQEMDFEEIDLQNELTRQELEKRKSDGKKESIKVVPGGLARMGKRRQRPERQEAFEFLS